MQAEALFAAWHEGMRLDGPPDAMLDPDPARRPTVPIPADPREPQEIAADRATVPAAPAGDGDLEELVLIIDALRTQPGAHLQPPLSPRCPPSATHPGTSGRLRAVGLWWLTVPPA